MVSPAGLGSFYDYHTAYYATPGLGQFTADARMLGTSAASVLISTACLNPRCESHPGSCGWYALFLRA